MANPNIEIQKRFVAAVFSGDEATVRALLDPEFVVHQSKDLEYRGVYRGYEGFKAFQKKFGEVFKIDLLDITKIYTTEDPDYLIAQINIRGTLLSSGRQFDTSMVEIIQFRNGKLFRIQPHWFERPE